MQRLMSLIGHLRITLLTLVFFFTTYTPSQFAAIDEKKADRATLWKQIEQEMNSYDAYQKFISKQGRFIPEIVQETWDPKQMKRINTLIKKAYIGINKPGSEGALPHNMNKNRRMRRPFDFNRTCREVAGFYYSGSDVATPEQFYVVAQAPMDHTVQDFWRLVLLRHCLTIVPLVMANDKKGKCAYYWNPKKFPMTVDDWVIKCGKPEVLWRSVLKSDHRITLRPFIAKNRKTKFERRINQIHYENWPDGGAPDHQLLIKLLEEVDKRHTKKDLPILVHCSAGIGRSGTFVAAHSVRKRIQRKKVEGKRSEDIRVNIPKLVFAIRLQRRGLVSNIDQLQTIYKVAANEL